MSFAWASNGTTPWLLADGSASYIYGPGGLPIEQVSTSGTASFYHRDQLGSTTMLTSASGVSVATFTYDTYGLLKSKSGAVSTPLLFAGQYQDSESGLYLLGARYYDPTTGQFVTSDPLRTFTRQPYSYAGDDPVNNFDPSGLSWYNPLSWTKRTWNDVANGVAATAGAVAVGVALVASAPVAIGVGLIATGVAAGVALTSSTIQCSRGGFGSQACSNTLLGWTVNTGISVGLSLIPDAGQLVTAGKRLVSAGEALIEYEIGVITGSFTDRWLATKGPRASC
jgi:RHS repeat-associated protein